VLVEEGVEVIGDVLVERCGVGVVVQGRGRVAVAEPGLGLEQRAAADEIGRDAVTKPGCSAGRSTPAARPRRRNRCESASAVMNVLRPGEPAKIQSATGSPTRAAHSSKWVLIMPAVVSPRVRRRVRFDFVGPN